VEFIDRKTAHTFPKNCGPVAEDLILTSIYFYPICFVNFRFMSIKKASRGIKTLVLNTAAG